MPYIAHGETDEELEKAIQATKKTLGFYLSTPSYTPVLKVHGWENMHPEAHRLSKLGKWDELGDLVSDEFLSTFAIVGNAEECARELQRRFGNLFDTVCGYTNGVLGLPPEIMLAARNF
jgi:Luciferase-like monooxygenase